MSGPIVPPLEVTEVDGSPDGRPITKIIVSNGDLTISGRTATIDTSGSGGSPATPVDSVQFNSDPTGTFTGDAGFVVSSAGGGASTRVDVGNFRLGLGLIAQTLDTDIPISAGAAGQITLSNNNDGGGTMADMQVNITAQSATDDPILQLGNLSAHTGELRIDGGTGDFIVTAEGTNKDLDLKVNGTGIIEAQNTTTNQASTLSVRGNGTGDSIIQLTNDSKSVSLKCDVNQKLKIDGGTQTFVFDASSATGGITWPDGTEQITAATGGSDAPNYAPFQVVDATGDTSFIPTLPTASSWGGSMTYGSAYDTPSHYPFYSGDYTAVEEMAFFFTGVAGDAGSTGSLAIYTLSTSSDAGWEVGRPMTKVTNSEISFATDTSGRVEVTPGSTVSLTAKTWYSIAIVGDQSYTTFPTARRASTYNFFWGDENYGGVKATGETDYTLPASYTSGTSWSASALTFHLPKIWWRGTN